VERYRQRTLTDKGDVRGWVAQYIHMDGTRAKSRSDQGQGQVKVKVKAAAAVVVVVK